jgi:hypothetical protein
LTSIGDGAAKNQFFDNLNQNEYQVMKSFLLSSQLSIICKSRETKSMIIRKQDTSYFGESVKKIIDEKIADL